MNILYFYWNECTSYDIQNIFLEFGYGYTKITHEITNYDNDPVFEQMLESHICSGNFDFIFTFNYFPIISKAASKHKIPYAAWIYDCPNLTLFSKTITNECNYFFVFDKSMLETLTELGAMHAYHLPLAAHSERLSRQLGLPSKIISPEYRYDISFVGSLYDSNMFDQINYLPDELRDFYNKLFMPDNFIWSGSPVTDALTDDIIEQTGKYISVTPDDNYLFTFKTILTNVVNSKFTSMERIFLLKQLAARYPLDLFTGSGLNISDKIRFHEPISYLDTMPDVFCRSKINLNITLRSIISGIPLRCIDILGAGGFLLSNKQPELEQYFASDEEYVSFSSPDELIYKARYYMKHDAERIEIARNGWEKTGKEFSYEKQFSKLIQRLPIGNSQA